MDSLQLTENSNCNKKSDGELSQVSSKSCLSKDSKIRKQKLPWNNVEVVDACSTRNELTLPENRFKLKPEQSYKKETKASRLGKSTGRWTHQEHLLFIEGLKIHGKNWKKVESFIGTRTGTQIRSHAQKFFNRIKKEFSTDDPSKYVIDNMGDDEIRKIILEHCGEEISNLNEEKDFSSDTPEVLFSITKEKVTKRKKDDVDSTPRSLGKSGSAFKSFKREEMDMPQKSEDSKIHGNNTMLKQPIWIKPVKPAPVWNPSLNQLSFSLGNMVPQQQIQNPYQSLDIYGLLAQALLTPTMPGRLPGQISLDHTNTLTHLLTILNTTNNTQ